MHASKREATLNFCVMMMMVLVVMMMMMTVT